MQEKSQTNSKEESIVIQPKSITVKLTPYAIAQFVRDLDYAINSIDTSERFSAANFFYSAYRLSYQLKAA